MARAIPSEPGETLDQLCWRALGATTPLEDVYAANPGLAALGTVLPAGTLVTLPETATVTPAAQTRETVQLWS